MGVPASVGVRSGIVFSVQSPVPEAVLSQGRLCAGSHAGAAAASASDTRQRVQRSEGLFRVESGPCTTAHQWPPSAKPGQLLCLVLSVRAPAIYMKQIKLLSHLKSPCPCPAPQGRLLGACGAAAAQGQERLCPWTPRDLDRVALQ